MEQCHGLPRVPKKTLDRVPESLHSAKAKLHIPKGESLGCRYRRKPDFETPR